MGKKLVIIGFLASLVLAMTVFLGRDQQSLRDNLRNMDAREPRVVLEDFVMYRYKGASIQAQLAGRLGQFYEPNLVELEGDVKAERGQGDTLEYIAAENATAYLESATMSKIMTQSAKLVRAELSSFVELGVKNHVLSTDYAEYLHQDQLVRSSRPVRVEGPGRIFTGDEGFVYTLANETLEMPGTVKGVMTLEEQKQ